MNGVLPELVALDRVTTAFGVKFAHGPGGIALRTVMVAALAAGKCVKLRKVHGLPMIDCLPLPVAAGRAQRQGGKQ